MGARFADRFEGMIRSLALVLVLGSAGQLSAQVYQPGPAPTIGDIQHTGSDPQFPGDPVEISTDLSLWLDASDWTDDDIENAGSGGPQTVSDEMGEVTWTVDSGPASVMPVVTFSSMPTTLMLDVAAQPGDAIAVTASAEDAAMYADDIAPNAPVTTAMSFVVGSGPAITIEVRNGQDPYGSSTSVCAGAVYGSPVHTADVRITTTPPTAGVTVNTLLLGGSGEDVPATLTIDTVTDSNGEIHGTVTSSDLLESATVAAGGSAATVSFNYDVESNWTSTPESLSASNSETINLLWNGQGVDGHNIEFTVLDVTYLDTTTGNVVTTEDSSVIDSLLYFSNGASTNTSGDATGMLEVPMSNTIIIMATLGAFDMSVYDDAAVSGPGLPTFFRRIGKFFVKGQKNFFRPGPPGAQPPNDLGIQIIHVPTTNNNPGGGTSPFQNARVAAGQVVQLSAQAYDTDEVRPPGAANWQKIGVAGFKGEYKVKVKLTGAKFDGTNDTEKTYKASHYNGVNGLTGDPASLIVKYNIPIKINDPFPANGKVFVEITFIDKIEIPLNLRDASVAKTAVQDPDASVTLQWLQSNALPTTSAIFQEWNRNNNQLQAPGTPTENEGITQVYQAGPLNPNVYAGVVVNEEFGGPQSNLDKLWVKQTYRILKGSHPSSWWWDHFFGSTATGVSTGTFMISNVHLFADTHNYPQSKFTLLDTKLNDVGLPKVIWFTNEQKYRVKPGNDGIIGTYTITHTRTPAANPANNVYTVKKQ